MYFVTTPKISPKFILPTILVNTSRKGEDIGLFITLVPKVNNVVLFVETTTYGAFIDFLLVGSLS